VKFREPFAYQGVRARFGLRVGLVGQSQTAVYFHWQKFAQGM